MTKVVRSIYQALPNEDYKLLPVWHMAVELGPCFRATGKRASWVRASSDVRSAGWVIAI